MNFPKQYTAISLAIGILTLSNGLTPAVQAVPVQAETTQQQAEEYYYQGLMQVNRENYQGAIDSFTSAIALRPDYIEAYYQRASVYAEYVAGKPPYPGQLTPGCERLDTGQLICQVDINQNWRRTNRQNAIDDLSDAIALNPEYAQAYHQRGLLQTDEQKAIADFELALHHYHQQGLNHLDADNPFQASTFLGNTSLVRQKLQSLTTLPTSVASSDNSENVGGSTNSPEAGRSADALVQEGHRLVGIPNYQAALVKYRQAARLYRERGQTRRYQEVREIISHIERKVARR